MKVEEWRHFEEASANLAKLAGKTFDELKKAGFKRKEALHLLTVLLVNFKAKN